MALTRRRFLQVGLAGAAVLVVVRILERPQMPAGAVKLTSVPSSLPGTGLKTPSPPLQLTKTGSPSPSDAVAVSLMV